MSTCIIKFDGEEVQIDYHFDCEDLIIDEMIGEDKYVFDYGSLHKDDKEEIEAKVLKYIEEKEDWVESEASEECTRRMEAEKPEVSYKLRNLVIIGDAYVAIAFNRDIVGTFTLRDGNKLDFEALSFADGTKVAIVTELRGRQVFSVDGDEWLM